MSHLINASSITKEQLQRYLQVAQYIKTSHSRVPHHPNKTLITMFYEPSTRTNCSFQAAAHKLGCKVIALTDKASSSEKGESLEDTIRTLGCYGNAIVLRHPEKGSAERAANISTVPIINGGDGNGEHPTQALLDVFTIYEEMLSRTGQNILQQQHVLLQENRSKDAFLQLRDSPLGRISVMTHVPFSREDDNDAPNNVNETCAAPPLTITFVGDLKNSRTIHSLIRLLTLCNNMRFIYVSPPSLEMPQEIVDHVSEYAGFEQLKMSSLESAIPETDVLYMTRIQRERFSTEEEYHNIMLDSSSYKLNAKLMRFAKEKMIIMHPLPRLDEIPTYIDMDCRAVYWKQVENGLYMRMAILDKIFNSS